MARKNLIGVSESLAEAGQEDRPLAGRPVVGVNSGQRPPTPIGGITRSLSNITQKVERAQELERQLAEGQTVIELDPDLVDVSFVVDRLGVAAEIEQALLQQIRDHGQQVPILVRPHPEGSGRYQVAYGHRRLAATRALGSKVRAVVRDLSDEQLVISQGQENNARTDLSFIERSLFATRLEDREFSRDVIMSSLGLDKAALSKMIAIVRRLPVPIIEIIGAAPSIGRRRWTELADLIEEDGKHAEATAFVTRPEFLAGSSDQRFEALHSFLRTAKARNQAIPWVAPDDTHPVRIRETSSETTLSFNRKAAPGFADFVRQRLKSLYLEYQEETGD